LPDQAGKKLEFMNALATITIIQSTPVVVVATPAVATATIVATLLAIAVSNAGALSLVTLSTATCFSIRQRRVHTSYLWLAEVFGTRVLILTLDGSAALANTSKAAIIISAEISIIAVRITERV
jgi:hypothetical protein